MSERERVEALAKVREAVKQGLRKCRVEDGAPVGLFRDSDLFHISHMVTEALMQTPAMRDLLAEAKADAWDEGKSAGLREGKVVTPFHDRFRSANPYRETSKEQADDVV